MKKNFLFVAVLFAAVTVSFTSCKKNECIECNGEIGLCEDTYDPADYGGVPWSSWKATATMSPNCKVVKQ